MVKTIGQESRRAMTLVEVIGVLAIIAIVASLLLPRLQKTFGQKSGGVIETVNDSKVDEALFNIETMKGAVVQHLARFGSLASRDGAPMAVSGAYDDYDRILLAEGIIEKPFALRMGTRAHIRLMNVSTLSAASPVTGSDGAYDLSGRGHNEIVGASFLVEAVIEGVSAVDAGALKARLGGPAMGGPRGNDLKGRVILRRVGPGSGVELHIYLAHR